MVQEYDPDLAEQVAAMVGHTFPMYSPMHLPSARGIWPLGSGTSGDNSNDISGQGRHLTDAGGLIYDIDNFMPFVNLDGATGYLFFADTAGISITGAMGMGCWGYFDDAVGNTEIIIGKWNQVGGGQRSYQIFRNSSGNIVTRVSVDGTAAVLATSTAVVAANTWACVGMSYDPSTSLSVFVGQEGGDDGLLEKTTNTTSIPASIFNSTADFAIGARNTSATPTGFMDGRVGLAFLCATLMPDKMFNLIYAQTRELLVV